MTVTWSLFTILSLIGFTESKCSPTSYYKNCWIRRFPGLYIDVEESQRRGAQLLNFYQEETALKCSRTCCLTRNFSCNLAVFHYNTSQEAVNCFHLHCPSLETCILRQRRNAILYNVTKGVDPDLLVFGKSFTTNLRLWPHMASSRLNASEPLVSDKRQFNRPAMPPIQPPTPMPAKGQTTFPQSLTKASTTSRRHMQPTQRDALYGSTTDTASTTFTSKNTQTSSLTSTQGSTSEPHQLTTAWQNTKPTSRHDQHETAVSLNTQPPLHQITPLSTYRTPASLHANLLRQHTTTASRHSTSELLPTKSAMSTEAKNPMTMAAPANVESQLYPNDTKGYISRNHTTGEIPEPGDQLSPVWHLAANTLLIAAATCSAVLVGCCCSVVVAVSWRGRRKKKGRYRTAWRGKKGSMRLVKYVIVRESL